MLTENKILSVQRYADQHDDVRLMTACTACTLGSATEEQRQRVEAMAKRIDAGLYQMLSFESWLAENVSQMVLMGGGNLALYEAARSGDERALKRTREVYELEVEMCERDNARARG